MNAPDPHHWTLNSCVSAFSTVWVYLGLFLSCPKLGAKGAEQVQLMQKFVPQSRVGIFRNERKLSAPLDPKLKFSCICNVWVHLGPFCHCTKLSAAY